MINLHSIRKKNRIKFWNGSYRKIRQSECGRSRNFIRQIIRLDVPVVKPVEEFSGKMKDDKFQSGKRYDSFGTLIYEGDFRNGKYNGSGTLYYESGTPKYKGKFSDGKYNGDGILYNEDGSVRKG